MRRLVYSAALALALLPVGVSALTQQGQRGWIGISYEVRPSRGGVSRVVITDVRRGSPAESAGIRAGDRLVAIESLTRVEDLMSVSKHLDLRAGHMVEIRLEREGSPLDLLVRAAERPGELFADVAVDWSVQTDSMVETMFRAMDSLRVHLLEANDREIAAPARRSGDATFPVLGQSGRDGVSAPFEFFVFRGERHDSLVRAMERLDREMEELQEQQADRLRELRRSRAGRRAEEQDRRLAELRGAIDELTRQSATLRSAMAEAARATAGWQYLLPSVEASPAPAPEPYRPLTPYLLGSNRVAGAQVIEVQPELGAYFGVESGVLVVEVSPGTPAAIAGLRPGDVVTRLDQVGVRTVEDLRFGVSQAGDTLPVTVVRQGASLQVLLRRR
jgi:predicted metalloprotease with PDZ domain